MESSAYSLEINNELINAQIALADNNEGKARVCARRAVQIRLQDKIGNSTGREFSAISGLQYLAETPEIPQNIRLAALRLQGGLRAKIEGNIFSENPIEDAEVIIRYFD